MGNTCIDSVGVQFSRYGVTLADKRKTIIQGDSVQLSPGIVGGIAPLSYQWTPNYNLSDSSSPNPWAKPDSTTSYLVKLTDSAGCQLTDPDPYEVFVIPVGLPNINAEKAKIDIYPNPLTKGSILKIISPDRKISKIEFYDVFGRTVKKHMTNKNSIDLKHTDFEKGVYLYQLFDEGIVLKRRKLIVE